jgi:hypothetical protein
MQTPERLFWVTILGFFLLFLPDMILYGQWVWKVNEITDYAVERMAAGGGWTAEVEEAINQKFIEENVDPNAFEISHTEDIVKAPNLVYYEMKTKYHVRAFAIFGRGMAESLGERTLLNIDVKKTKPSEIY